MTDDAAPADPVLGAVPLPEGGAGPDRAGSDRAGPGLSAMMGVRMEVQIVLAEARMTLAEIMRLGPDAVIDLDRRVGDPVDVVVGGRLVARGDLVRTEAGRVAVSLTEVLTEPGGVAR